MQAIAVFGQPGDPTNPIQVAAAWWSGLLGNLDLAVISTIVRRPGRLPVGDRSASSRAGRWRRRSSTRSIPSSRDYRATRPKVERKFGHLMRRKHGGRRARVRGTTKIAADFTLLAAAVNLARLAGLGVASTRSGWAAAAG